MIEVILTCSKCKKKFDYTELRPTGVQEITRFTTSITYSMKCPNCGNKSFQLPVDTSTFKGIIGVTGK